MVQVIAGSVAGNNFVAARLGASPGYGEQQPKAIKHAVTSECFHLDVSRLVCFLSEKLDQAARCYYQYISFCSAVVWCPASATSSNADGWTPSAF